MRSYLWLGKNLRLKYYVDFDYSALVGTKQSEKVARRDVHVYLCVIRMMV